MDKNTQTKNDDLKTGDKNYNKDQNIKTPGQQKDIGSQQTGGVKQDKDFNKKQDRSNV